MVCFLQSWKKMSYYCLILALLSEMVSSVSAYVYSQKTIDIYDYCGWNVKDVGCPLNNDNYWDCLEDEFDCPDGSVYHCARLFEDKTKFVDGCAPIKTCLQGEAPYLIKEKYGQPTKDFHIRCAWCYGDTYNSMNRPSATYSECLNKIRCDSQHGIECLPENMYDRYKQDRLCRCDARNNYVLFDTSNICTSDSSIAPYCNKKEPCGKTKERLLNYTCAEKCENGYRSEKSDDCIPYSKEDIPHSTDEPSVTEDLNNTTDNTMTRTATTTTTTTTRTVMPDTSTTEHRPTTFTANNEAKMKPDHKVLPVVLGVSVTVAFLAGAIVVLCVIKCWRRRQTKSRGDVEVPLLGKENFEVRICVTSEKYSDNIERARPHVSNLNISRRLQTALTMELSRMTEVKHVTVLDLRKGSLIVVFLIETEGLHSAKSLKLPLLQLVEKRKCGEFTLDPRHFEFGKYSDLAPLPRRPSVIDAGDVSPYLQKPKRKRAYSLPVSFSNGNAVSANAPLANQKHLTIDFDKLTEVSETEDNMDEQNHVKFTLHSPSSSDEHSAALWFHRTPQQSETGSNTCDYPYLKPAITKTVQRRYQQSPQPSCSGCSEDCTEKIRSQYATMRRVSSSFDNLGLATEYSPPPLKSYQSQWALDKKICDEVARETLGKNLTELLKCLQPDSILHQFQKDNFMSDTAIRDIREEKTTTEKIRKIIDAVKHRGYKGFHYLMEIIRLNQLDLSKVQREFQMGLQERQAHPEKYQTEDEIDHDSDTTDIDAVGSSNV